MHVRKTLIALLAAAVAIAFSPLAELQAATFGPGSQPGTDTLIHAAKVKKRTMKAGKKGKRRGMHRRGKRARSKAGRCGAYMYFSKKARKCLDARNK